MGGSAVEPGGSYTSGGYILSGSKNHNMAAGTWAPGASQTVDAILDKRTPTQKLRRRKNEQLACAVRSCRLSLSEPSSEHLFCARFPAPERRRHFHTSLGGAGPGARRRFRSAPSSACSVLPPAATGGRSAPPPVPLSRLCWPRRRYSRVVSVMKWQPARAPDAI